MADSSLDDFFAKKDKTKKKQKVKEGGEDKQAKKDKKKRDKDSGLGLGLGSNILNDKKDEEEWKDFEEEKKADYTGLRIQTLQIASKEEQDKESGDGDDDDDEDGENRRDGHSGPWAKTKNSQSETKKPKPTSIVPEATSEPTSTPAAKGPSKYIPPSMRHASSSGPVASSHPIGGSRRKKEAPNVNSEVDFPTLGGGPSKSQGSDFYLPSSYDYIDTTGGRKGVSLTLENKFSALQD